MGSHGLAFKEWAPYWDDAISELKGRRVGIDAEEYLAGLLISQNREPLLPALGGLPFSLKHRVDDDLQRFKDAGIEVQFVFNGLEHACRDRASILKSSLRATETLESAWRIYDSGKGDEAVSAFGRACTYRIYHIIRSLQAYLNSKNVQIFVAPYSAAAQLVEFERQNYITAVMGSASCLVFGAEQIILEFDWESKKFYHTDAERCAGILGVTEGQFLDLCLLSGYSILPAMSELDVDSNIPRLEAAKLMLQRSNNDALAMAGQSKDDGYQEQFHNARMAVKHAVRMKVSTLEVVQDNFDTAPADLHTVISQRLPNELYFYLIRGLAGPRVLNWRTRMEIVETPPLDGGLSPTYKDLVNTKLVPLRSQSLVIITHLLHRYYQKHDVELLCWFNENNRKALNITDNVETAKQANYWHVTAQNLPSSGDPTGAPLRYAITSLLDDAVAKKTVTHHAENTPAHLSQISELRPNVIWRFLEHRGYINKDHTLSALGKALDVALQKAADNGSLETPALANEIEEAIFMAFELIRLDSLNARNMFQAPPYSGQPMRGTETDKQNTLLLSRIASLGRFQHGAIGYTGPLSRHLLAYHQVAAAVRGALRDLVEMHACNMFLCGSVKRQIGPPKMFSDLSFSLPFVEEPDAGLALLVKSYLDELSNEPHKRTNIADWFAHAQDIEGDLEKVWKLFDAINAGVQAADSSVINADTRKMFKNAGEWLEEKRAADSVNGTA